MGIEWYLIDQEKKEAFDLGKGGWSELLDVITAPDPESFSLAIVRAWCGWAMMTPEEYEAEIADPRARAYGIAKERPTRHPTREEIRQHLDARWVLHASGVYVLRDRGDGPYDFDADRAYAQTIADDLWDFVDSRERDPIDLINDANDLPWRDASVPRDTRGKADFRGYEAACLALGWRCVGTRYTSDRRRCPFALPDQRY